MTRTNKIITISVAAVTLIGLAAWYFVNAQQASKTNEQTTQTTATDSKFATLKGDAFDEAYLGDMIAHHEGAVNMAEMAGASAEQAALKDMAQKIIQTQSQEIGKMRDWQSAWGYKPTMSGHGSHSGTANDMAGSMMNMGDALADLNGAAFDKKFLELMIMHHEQAVDMSKYAAANASHQEIKDLAAAIISAQEQEITQMKQWQQNWGYASTTSDTSSSMSGMQH